MTSELSPPVKIYSVLKDLQYSSLTHPDWTEQGLLLKCKLQLANFTLLWYVITNNPKFAELLFFLNYQNEMI